MFAQSLPGGASALFPAIASVTDTTSGDADSASFADLAQRMDKARESERKLLAEALEAVESFKAEKEAMAKMIVKDEDIIALNVGGRLISTTRGCLTQEEGLLPKMFSGVWDESFATDKEGRMFLDFDPDCFDTMLYHLRLKQMTGRTIDWCKVKPPPDKAEYFEALAIFMELVKEDQWAQEPVQLPKRAPTFGSCAGGIQSAEGGTKVTHASQDRSQRWAVGAETMENGVFTWGVRINSLPRGEWVNLGVIGVQNPPNDNSEGHATANGWACRGQVYKNGVDHPEDGGWQGFQNSDEVRLRLNADRGVLEMKVARLGDRVFQISDLGRERWRVHATFYRSGSSIEVFPSDF